MDASRGSETPGSKTKVLIIQSTAGSMSFMFALVLFNPHVPWDDVEWPKGMPHVQWVCVTVVSS